MLSRLDTALTDACNFLAAHAPAVVSLIGAATALAFYCDGALP